MSCVSNHEGVWLFMRHVDSLVLRDTKLRIAPQDEGWGTSQRLQNEPRQRLAARVAIHHRARPGTAMACRIGHPPLPLATPAPAP